MLPDPDPRPLLFVTVGTDHHPFDRLMAWLDRWIELRGDRARVLVQSGTSSPPELATWKPNLSREEMGDALSYATAIVAHGGPGTILEARDLGFVPIVVPRRAEFGEHVDDHQVAFTKRLGDRGEIWLAETEERFHALLDRALAGEGGFRAPARRAEVARTVMAFEQAVEPILDGDRSLKLAEPPLRILYVGGLGRSGTTLLERILGEIEGFWSAGELVHLWRRGLAEGNLCSCGATFSECPFWHEVGKKAFGGWGAIDPYEVISLQRAVDRQRYAPLLLAPGSYAPFEGNLLRLHQFLAPLYRAIQTVSGAEIVVDSSKHASYAYVLRTLPRLDLGVLHTIRDSRGVAHSWTKRVRRPEIANGEDYMATWPPAKTAVQWMSQNGLLEILRATGVPTMRMAYEDLVRDPTTEIERVLHFAGRDPRAHELDFLGEGYARLGDLHSVSGNPMRFRSGGIPLRLDEGWRTDMKGPDRALVGAITWPLLRRYGYLTRGR